MKKIVILIIVLSIKVLFADSINLNFFFDVKIDSVAICSSDSLLFIQNEIQKITNDTLSDQSYNFFLGEILEDGCSDSLIVHSLEKLLCDYSCPTDFDFTYFPSILDYKIIGSNINYIYENNAFTKEVFFETDSLKIGLLSVYTPDWIVKNRIENIEFDYSYNSDLKKRIIEMREKCDKIILLSNYSKYVNEKLSKKWNVDYIISFDYAKASPKIFNKKTYYYNIKYKSKWMAQLLLKFEDGKFEHKWIPKKYNFKYAKPNKTVSEKTNSK